MCLCMCIHVFMYVHSCVYVCAFMCLCMCIHVFMYVHLCVYVCAFMCLCMCIYAYVNRSKRCLDVKFAGEWSCERSEDKSQS